MTRQAISMTVGSSAAESSALTGGGASLCASGSQLCTGAQPIFAASPTRIRTNASSVVWPGSACACAGDAPASRASRSDAAVRRQADEEDEDPQQRDVSPKVVSTRYFQPASSALRLPLKATSSAEAAVRRLDQQPGDAEVVDQRQREQRRPEEVEGRRSTRRGRARRVNKLRPAWRR